MEQSFRVLIITFYNSRVYKILSVISLLIRKCWENLLDIKISLSPEYIYVLHLM